MVLTICKKPADHGFRDEKENKSRLNFGSCSFF